MPKTTNAITTINTNIQKNLDDFSKFDTKFKKAPKLCYTFANICKIIVTQDCISP